MSRKKQLLDFIAFFSRLAECQFVPLNCRLFPTIKYREDLNSEACIESIKNGHASNIGIRAPIVLRDTREFLYVFDIDHKYGEKKGFKTKAELQEEFGPLPRTRVVQTLTGGEHHYFRHKERLARVIDVYEHVDFLGTGGIIKCPPTYGYNWVHEIDLDLGSHQFTELPPYIVTAVRSKKKRSYSHHGSGARDIRNYIRKGNIPEGTRDDTIFRESLRLMHAGLHVDRVIEIILSINESHCKPPLPTEQVVKCVDSAARYYILSLEKHHA